MRKDKLEDIGLIPETTSGNVIGSVCPESLLKIHTTEKLVNEGVDKTQHHMANLYKDKNHIADAGKKVESQRTCGTCNWCEPMNLKVQGKGFCNYPLPDLPISLTMGKRLDCDLVEVFFTACPTWEGEE